MMSCFVYDHSELNNFSVVKVMRYICSYDYGSSGGYGGGYAAADPYSQYGANQYGGAQYGANPYGASSYGGYSGGYGGAAGDYGAPMGGGS